MDVVKMLSRQNDREYKISEKYIVGFYTIAAYAIFRYYEKRSYGLWEIGRDSMLGRLSLSEIKKLFAFEREKKKEFQTIVVYGAPKNDEEKSDENKIQNIKYNKTKTRWM